MMESLWHKMSSECDTSHEKIMRTVSDTTSDTCCCGWIGCKVMWGCDRMEERHSLVQEEGERLVPGRWYRFHLLSYTCDRELHTPTIQGWETHYSRHMLLWLDRMYDVYWCVWSDSSAWSWVNDEWFGWEFEWESVKLKKTVQFHSPSQLWLTFSRPYDMYITYFPYHLKHINERHWMVHVRYL